MPPYQVLVVDDSIFMRKLISDLISENPLYTVIATAKNGRDAVEKTKLHKPDVVTMDVEMPEMDGLQALKIIMIESPTPVIMLSNLTKAGANETIQALEWGAVDFVKKPSGSISLDLHKVKQLLFEKLDIAVHSKVKNNVIQPSILERKPTSVNRSIHKGFNQIVALGTSTGGPRALQQVISMIPEAFPAPIVIVQHMPPNFTKSLAQRLDAISNIRVVEAEDGMPLEASTAYIAPGGFHMTIYKDGLKNFCLRTSKEDPRSGHRPSVDMMFESLIPFTELKKYVVLMTGMGSDGAKGMLALKRAGAVSTIAESEETCIVYGMPRAAVELLCVDHILPQQKIAEQLILDIVK
ncbi:chemotaxis response regulator protein-glutamate methylesterase [Paenibacillus psychroresistens]|uniref:Protein-glutamate methylesterase/protein-glutamine glutaminase n=1 Tax=Paenibacillus psychroresistens TaxID=1778678 RepID=A0A6B8RJM6_9BACL|nr:chemotaxis response regulator protein-glutamate methylesterase [Paenibacillus psychroresistens]QGQ96249.1 chemotaxis response regulator protein-glutamate methylesterase [Paenibacillus psychroresistens]